MKKFHVATIMVALMAGICFAGATAAQTPASASSSQSTPMSVLVSVSDKGQVTGVRYAEKLPDSVSKLLRKTLDKWIVKPAVDNGRRVPSQMLVKVNLVTKPDTNGQTQAYFTYVSTQAIPKGRTWKIIDGNVVVTGGEYMRENEAKQPPSWAPPPIENTKGS
ncbi:hypothetical protein [Bordetella sp.]|uniref:hypothetical protein n=1 Tax=Bordetella sp. TaxID=28081 RepID=UPI0016B4A2BB|nr:hypothetical protein [Rhodanobacter denitrificans]